MDMTISTLTDDEREIIRRSMEATFNFFDFDFQTRLGVTPEEMKNILQGWFDIDDSSDDSLATLAINNSMNDLLHGEGIKDDKALELIGVNCSEMLRVYRKWAANRGWNSTGIM